MATTKTSPNEFRHQVNTLMSKLSDRDTESTAVSSLTSLIPTLTSSTLPPFISAITTTNSSDSSSFLRHSLRLLSLLSAHHPTSILRPHLPLLLSLPLRHLQNPNSSVRNAILSTISSLAPHFNSSAQILNPLLNALFQQQEPVAQSTTALALAAALDVVGGDAVDFFNRVLPRLVRLYRSKGFRAKAALIAVLGTAGTVGGVSELEVVVGCVVEGLGSGEWSVRKAAAEGLLRIGVARSGDLGELRDSCLVVFEKRRFDKVRVVRETMIQMIDVWKDIQRAGGEDCDVVVDAATKSQSNFTDRGNVRDARYKNASLGSGSVQRSPPLVVKNKVGSSRSPPPTASPVPAARKNAPSIRKKKLSTPSSQKNDQKSAGLIDEIAVFNTPRQVASGGTKIRNIKEPGVREGSGIRSKLERRQISFDKNSEENGNKLAGEISVSHIVPLQESDTRDIALVGDIDANEKQTGQKEDGISTIRMQLMQIENQQSSLMDLLQKFVGNSQNGILSLETRVHGLEKALNEISHDLVLSKRMHNDSTANNCCKLPGVEFLTPKFWRKTKGKNSSRFSSSDIEKLAEKDRTVCFNWGKNKHGIQGEIITNPLAEMNPPPAEINPPPSRSSTDVSSNTVVKSIIYDAATHTR